MYIYIDESTFVKNGEEYHGVGLFVTKEKIQEEIIDQSLNKLKNDPDIYNEKTKPMDMDTINRGYFHSADDSKNAHSHLCRTISENLNGIFKYSYTKPSVESDERTLEEIHRLNTKIVSLIITDYSNPIHIYIEQRTKLTQNLAERLIEDLYSSIDLSTYSHPFLSAYYPQVFVNVVDKDNPGIQVVDFILWAVNNKYSENKKSIWVKYLGLEFSNNYDQPEGDMAGGNYILNAGFQNEDNRIGLNVYPHNIFPLKDDYYNDVDFETLYILAEQFIHYFQGIKLPQHVTHFGDEINNITKILKASKQISKEHIREVARIFIRLFDTLPIYSDLDKDRDYKQFELLLHIRRCMGLIISGQILGEPAVDFFKAIRDGIEDKSLLYERPDLDKWFNM